MISFIIAFAKHDVFAPVCTQRALYASPASRYGLAGAPNEAFAFTMVFSLRSGLDTEIWVQMGAE